MTARSPLSLPELIQLLRAFPATLLGEVGVLPEPPRAAIDSDHPAAPDAPTTQQRLPERR